MMDLGELVKNPAIIKDIIFAREYRKQVIFLSASALIILFSLVLIIYKVPELAGTSKQISDLNRELDTLDHKIKRLDSMKAKNQKMENEIKEYSKGIPGEKDIPQLLEELSAVAKASGVKILSITPSKLETVISGKKDKAYYQQMPITITAQSGYHQLGTFVSSLENSKRFITIEGLHIQGDMASPESHKIKMVLITYVAI